MGAFVFIWLAFGVVTAMAAKARGRDPVGWFIIGAIGGLFGLIAVLVMENLAAGSTTPRE